MVDYIVDESKFLIKDESYQETSLPYGLKLASGIQIGDLEDESDKWELYLSSDGKHYILAVNDELYQNWVSKNYLKSDEFQTIKYNNNIFHLLFSKSSHIISRLTNLKNSISKRFAFKLYSAFTNSRLHDVDVNLRDGIYIERLSTILPTYSLVGKVSDRALFKNSIRTQTETEDLSTPDGLNDGLSYPFVRNYLKNRNYKVSSNDPLFETGEVVDDFLVKNYKNTIITAPLIITDNYQLFDTNGDEYLLVLESLFANALISINFISQINLKTIPLNSKKYFVLGINKDKAVERLDDRTFGQDKDTLFDLALAISRTRNKFPNADLTNGLYIQEIGYVLPENFTKSENTDDRSLMWDILRDGPFAMTNLLDDANLALLNIATSKN